MTPDNYYTTSHNQSGGVTAGKIEIHAPTPGVTIETAYVNQELDQATLDQIAGDADLKEGRYRSLVDLRIASAYAASALRVGVKGQHIVDAGLASGRGSARDVVHHVERPTTAVLGEGSPLSSQYQVNVLTSEPDDLTVEAFLET